MSGRIEQIEKMLAKAPQDLFLHYSLAMEYVAAGRYDEAVAAFGRCKAIDGEYLPAHVELAKTLRSAGRLAEAKAAFAAAMDLATTKGEKHVADYVRQQMEGLVGG